MNPRDYCQVNGLFPVGPIYREKLGFLGHFDQLMAVTNMTLPQKKVPSGKVGKMSVGQLLQRRAELRRHVSRQQKAYCPCPAHHHRQDWLPTGPAANPERTGFECRHCLMAISVSAMGALDCGILHDVG